MEILEKIMQIKNKALNSSDLKELISKKKKLWLKKFSLIIQKIKK